MRKPNPLSDSRLGPLSERDVKDLKQARGWRAGQDRREFGSWDKEGDPNLRGISIKVPQGWLDEVESMMKSGYLPDNRSENFRRWIRAGYLRDLEEYKKWVSSVKGAEKE